MVKILNYEFKNIGSNPIRHSFIKILKWDEAVVAYQTHDLNVIGSNPIPTLKKLLGNITGNV